MNRFSVAAIAAAAAIALRGAPSVTASIVQRAGDVAGESILTVHLQPAGLTLGSYQGVFHFAPGALAIISATVPTADGSRFVNVADSAMGIVRFAGFTVSGFKTYDVLILTVRPMRKLESAGLSADVGIAADLNGVAVGKDWLIPARGVTATPPR